MPTHPARAIAIQRRSGAAVRDHLDAVAALRIAVFRDWPYLYDGDAAYEREYLDAYASSPDSVFVLAFDGDAVIGTSTGLPLAAMRTLKMCMIWPWFCGLSCPPENFQVFTAMNVSPFTR